MRALLAVHTICNAEVSGQLKQTLTSGGNATIVDRIAEVD